MGVVVGERDELGMQGRGQSRHSQLVRGKGYREEQEGVWVSQGTLADRYV